MNTKHTPNSAFFADPISGRLHGTQNEKCPHCGWTPAEQDKLSNDCAELLAALRAVEHHLAGLAEQIDSPESRRFAAIARAAIAKAEGV